MLEFEKSEEVHSLSMTKEDICIHCVFEGIRWAAKQGAALLSPLDVGSRLNISQKEANKIMMQMPHIELPDKKLRVSGIALAEWLKTRECQANQKLPDAKPLS
jgi:hypothetical protein